MRVVKERDGGVVRKVLLVDGNGGPVGPVCRFLAHLGDREFSPNTLCAYGYDLKYLFTFLKQEGLDWQEFRPPRTRCSCWRSCGGSRAAGPHSGSDWRWSPMRRTGPGHAAVAGDGGPHPGRGVQLL